ncbi:hypothetical protein AA2016_2486 [Aminobacter aminovorans]|jgi:hypothetical protein|uniref:DUF3137 domain-containing protein n=1 Tax=Aminobacter aminovorans TaxID=83263 RepID=A0AAC8YNK1_AMIAI|nr:DUF3137 domain-containing protein [Aminobacter aminovorans]AMS41411.1 hypothetical protein AA2016_2486 [Aminobacter aminovorans]
MSAAGFMPDEATTAGIKKDLEAYQAERNAIRLSTVWRVPLYLGGVIVAVLVLALIFNFIADLNEQWLSTPHVYLYVVGFIAAFFAYFRAMRPLEAANASFRNKLLPIVFGFIKNMRHERGATPPSFVNLPESTVGKYNNLEIDDFISGNYDGFDFELYETLLTQRAEKHDSTTFQGVIVAFGLKKPFEGTLVATIRTNAVLSFFGELFGSGLKELRSGGQDLDMAYEFRSDNVEAAQPLVSGQMAQALTWLKEAWPGEPARIALSGTSGFLLLPHQKDFFELPASDVALDYKVHVEPMIADMATILATASLVRKIGS